jgi:hypothetical protein
MSDVGVYGITDADKITLWFVFKNKFTIKLSEVLLTVNDADNLSFD